jgi:type II secretory pathway pseudopilin PulG
MFIAPTERRSASQTSEDGLGLVEIVISMFMLALLALALLPLLITGLQTSIRNTTLATATQLVGQEIEQARLAARSSCATLVATFASVTVSSTTDSRGVVLQPVRTVSSCPAVYPGTVTVTSVVTGDGKELSRAVTKVLVFQ